MVEAFKQMIERWKDFEGRTSRPDYWWATLATCIISIVVSIIIAIPFGIAAAMDRGAGIFIALGVILAIAASVLGIFLAIAGLSMSIRRIRDAGFPWWFWFVNFVPSVGNIAFIVLLCFPSSDEPRVDFGGNGSASTVTPSAAQAAPAAAAAAAPVVDVTPEEAPVVEETVIDKINNTAEAVEAKIDEAVDTVAEKVEDAVSTDWTCPSCGMKNDGKFCSVCGAKKP
ncbi:MAG: DUF805 domain-containing protein [Clostridia bacterium]|nr:DUF805 domain-containing protein [Clostridia bacterium]MBR6479074.1 DUF805 domain-containing protein [Clostridia bacterium]MBR6512792.1 DUF805 domain-containing protein [Clostridia bacterium]